MGQKVVIAYTGLGDNAVERPILEDAGIEIVNVDGLDSPTALDAVRDADALMVTLNLVRADLIEQFDRCRIICRVGTGVDAIDIDAATARGIWVTNVADYAVDEVSTHALTLTLALLRNLPGHTSVVARGNWAYQTQPPIQRLTTQTLGILGFGRIGSAMGRKSRGAGFRVIAHDPYIDQARIQEAGVEPVDYDTLLRNSDILSLHVPLTSETRRLIDADALARMKPSAYLVNTARGEVVDVNALLAAVQAGRLAGAGIDVLPVEPPNPGDPVLHEPRIIVTPHMAWASAQSAVEVRQRGAEDVVRVLRGEPPRYPVNNIEDVLAALV
ncbi:MAG TPA: C-terminal binding protein [Thermomicrobiales bacterium]|nr:C-terminal binding protein [Thermomicrobiales bacterium]